jgi:chromosome partitioning protein
LGVTRRPLDELVRQAPEPWSSNLYFVPFREITMVEMRRRMASIGNTKEMMRGAIDSLRSAFEYVVIDTAPDMDDLLFAIFSASDYVIVPVEMDNFALEGAARITEKVKNLSEASGKPQILGYLANKVVGRRIGDKNVLDGLASMFDSQVYQVAIPTSIDIRYSQAVGRDIYGYAPSSPIAAAMGEMVEETLRRIKSLPAKPRHAGTG